MAKTEAQFKEVSTRCDKKERECEGLIKEKDFLQYRVQRLESQVGVKERVVIKEEVVRDMDADHRIRHLIAENDRLKEDLMSSLEITLALEKSNCCLYTDVESMKYCQAEADRLRDLSRRAEVEWGQERQHLIDEISELRSVGLRGRSRSGDHSRSANHLNNEYNRYYESSGKSKTMYSTTKTAGTTRYNEGTAMKQGSSTKKSSTRILVN